MSKSPTARILGQLTYLECAYKNTGASTWMAQCPAHDDNRPSLSIRTGREGRVLLHCFAGCTIDAILEALFVPPRDLFDEDGDAPVPVAPDADPLPSEDKVAEWRETLRGTTGLGARLWTVKAWSPQTLRWAEVGWDGQRLTIPNRGPGSVITNLVRYHPGGKDPKVLVLKGRPRGLFPAPERFPKDEPLWLVEGESDGLSARELRIPAVGVPGVNGWREEFVQRLSHASRVIVCFDCDAPGRKAAQAVCESLKAGGVDATVFDLDPARDDGYDLSDLLLEARADDGLADARNLFAGITRGDNLTEQHG